MSEVMKSVLATILVFLITVTGVTVVKAANEAAAAGDYLEAVAAVIAESNYSSLIIQECMTEAAGNGYELKVEIIGADVPGLNRYAEITLGYQYELLGVAKTRTRRKIR